VLSLMRARRSLVMAWILGTALTLLAWSSVFADGGGTIVPH
jgi:hypothetical protein